MSVLGKSALRQCIERKEIKLTDDGGRMLPEWFDVSMGQLNSDPVNLQPASIDLTLGDEWLVPRANVPRSDTWMGRSTDTKLPVEYDTGYGPSFIIPAHGFILARTKEVVHVAKDLFAKVEGRSSVGRTGLIVETAGVVDPGFVGSITLELFNCLPHPIVVHAGTRICQLVFSRVDGDTEGGYQSSKYQGQRNATGSKLHMDFQK